MTVPLIVLVGVHALASRVNASSDSPPSPEHSAGEVNCALKGIQLEDQFGDMHEYAFPTATPMILLVADKKGNDALAQWIEEVRTRWSGKVAIVGVADVRGVPGLFQGRVKRKFRTVQSHPVLMDWKGDLLDGLNPQPGLPNIYLVSCAGTVLLHLAGEATPGRVHELADGARVTSSEGSPPGVTLKPDGFN